MFSRKRLPIWALVVVLILALAGLGLGYAHWTWDLEDEGTVTTGQWHADWFNVFTDDDGAVVDSTKDDGDTGDCETDSACLYGQGSRDPSSPGPNPTRYDKAIGSCGALIDEFEDYQVLHWSVSNAYPSYHCTVWAHIRNTGSVPMKLTKRSLALNPGSEGRITTGFVNDPELYCGAQIDPNETFPIGVWVHVEQDAQWDGATYGGTSDYELVNWNEFDPSMCAGW